VVTVRPASKPNRWRLVLALVYLISTAVLVIKMASPTNIQITFQGEREVYQKEVPNVYTFTDMFVIAASAIAMSSSVLILVLRGGTPPQFGPSNTEIALKTLSENERKIYTLILEREGIAFQSDLVEASYMSKSAVSIILDRLEAKGLIEKRKRGMGNVLIAKLAEPAKESSASL